MGEAMPNTRGTGMPYGWGRVSYRLEDRLPYMDLPFPVEEYKRRIARLQEKLRSAGFDAIVVLGNRADMSYVRYLSNFEDFYGGETMVVVPADGDPALTTNAIMHGEPMHSGIQNVWMADVRCAPAPRTVTADAEAATIYDHLGDLLRERKCTQGRIGVCGDFAQDLLVFLTTTFPDIKTDRADHLLAEMRAVKSGAEISVIRQAAHVADLGLEAAMEAVRPGVTEYGIAAEANRAMFSAGSEHPAFPIAVVAGKRAGFKHLSPTDYTVQRGDMVFVDLGARYMGYYSDCSRQRVCGDPSAEQLEFMETQIQIVEAVTRQIRPGAVVADVARIGIEIAEDAGYGEYLYFRGHGIGCHTHDLPSLSPTNRAMFETGMIFCFEPMLVKKEFGCACWEDMWLVTEDGVERLNQAPIRWW